MKPSDFFLLPVLIFSFCTSGNAQPVHNGLWWHGMSPGAKEMVVTGFLDGMALGHNLSLMGAGNSSDADCRTKIAESYTYVRGRYFKSVAPGDIVSALDDLYSESDNGSIIFGRAVWIAVKRLGGTSKDDIQKLILQSRGVDY